jgi:zinc ribbon protein
VDQISGTTPTDAPTQAQDGSRPADASEPSEHPEDAQPGFGSRGRARRRARFLRKARELAYRDLGGLVFNLHRFDQRNDALVLAKLTTLGKLDAELRALERALQEREPVTVLREAGITACPRCAAIHSSEDRFCPNCGLSMARHVDLPIAGPAAPAVSPAAPASAGLPTPPSEPSPAAAQPATDAAHAPSSAAQAQAAPPVPGQPVAAPPPEPSPAAAPPATAAHAPVPAHRPGAATDAEQREATEILHPGAPRT